MANCYRKTNNWKFLWTINGTVYLRQKEVSDTVTVRKQVCEDEKIGGLGGIVEIGETLMSSEKKICENHSQTSNIGCLW